MATCCAVWDSHSKLVEAAWVLFSINKDEAETALELSCRTEKDEEVKREFKSVIERIEQGY